MFDEPFAQGPSPVHALDPRVRLCMAGLGAVCLALTHTLPAALTSCLLGAALLICSRPPLPALVKRMLVVNLFVLFLWATVPWSIRGHALFSCCGLDFSREGLALCLLVTLKTNGILWLFLALAASMTSPAAGYAMEKLGMPAKLVFLFLFTYRYIHVIAEEWQRMGTATRLRGFTPHTDMHTYRTAGYMLGMVLVRSYDRARRVYEAMLLRGFHGRFFSVVSFHARPRDAVFTLLMLAALTAILVLDRWEMLHV